MDESAANKGEMGVKEIKKKRKKTSGDGGGEGEELQKYLLPRMVLRVLLVESDDSTRQIIAALLRKCSYRVAAVSDGLKAWETLRGRPHNVDLILTELELPSISGYALLTLVMEHDICKNIPVIMMSYKDSISMVLKCMLKGAADFLIKPVRRNELRNLWQHVWRRQIQTARSLPQGTNLTQQNVEVTSEDSTASNNSSDNRMSLQISKQCSEKESDAQGPSQAKFAKAHDMTDIMDGATTEEIEKSIIPKCESGVEVSSCHGAYDSVDIRVEGGTSTSKEDEVQLISFKGNDFTLGENNFCSSKLAEPPNNAINFMEKFVDGFPADTHGQCCLDGTANKTDDALKLELSLRSFHLSSSKVEVAQEPQVLNHSKASAFSKYDNNRIFRPLLGPLALSCAISGGDAKASSELPVTALSNSHGHMKTSVLGEPGESEVSIPAAPLGFIPIPAVRFDSACLYPQILFTQTGFASVWSPRMQNEQSPVPASSSIHSTSEVYNSEPCSHLFDENTAPIIDQIKVDEEKIEPMEEVVNSSPALGSGNLHSGITSKHSSSFICGSICETVDDTVIAAASNARATASESVNEGNLLGHDGQQGVDSHYTSQRKAALIKFRLKRKERCYEKKVRYQSRKRLAEQRPRVKGQFVRQVKMEVPHEDDDGCG